jgi:hypothetical protein
VRFGRTQTFASHDAGATFEDLREDPAVRELGMTGRQLLAARSGRVDFNTPRDERVLVDDEGGITVRETIVPPESA